MLKIWLMKAGNATGVYIRININIKFIFPECNGNLKKTDLIEQAIRLTLKNNGSIELVEEEAAMELENTKVLEQG
ncbi:MAG: hypothetical protein MZU84_03515 [Sphingobacterium sp.]|nr:hypothetical protein [Sphingobacterium sp.]